jgi:hypothetical protein
MGKITALLLLICLAISITIVATQRCRAQYLGSVIIKADGTVEPIDAPIQQVWNTYILIDDIGGISVQKSNIILDGNGHMLPGVVYSVDSQGNTISASNAGGISLNQVQNVTVKNLIIRNCQTGLVLDRAIKCVVTNNTILGTYVPIPQLQVTGGIVIWEGSSNIIIGNRLISNYVAINIGGTQNTITQNLIETNSYGIANWNSVVRNNTFFLNSFINNTAQAIMDKRSIDSWDKDNKGNYWSNYNGMDVNGDGVGDTPYIIDMNNQDNYPLMRAYEKPKSTPSSTPPEPFQTAPLTLTVVSVVTVVFVGVSLIVYLKKNRR